MSFVRVQHKDGREADITAGEVAFYRTIGFRPAPGSVIEDADEPNQGATAPVQAPLSGTDQRLDLVLDELRGLRADISAITAPGADKAAEQVDGDTIELREPETPAGGESDFGTGAGKETAPEKQAATKPKRP